MICRKCRFQYEGSHKCDGFSVQFCNSACLLSFINNIQFIDVMLGMINSGLSFKHVGENECSRAKFRTLPESELQDDHAEKSASCKEILDDGRIASFSIVPLKGFTLSRTVNIATESEVPPINASVRNAQNYDLKNNSLRYYFYWICQYSGLDVYFPNIVGFTEYIKMICENYARVHEDFVAAKTVRKAEFLEIVKKYIAKGKESAILDTWSKYDRGVEYLKSNGITIALDA